jgi:hypothetical protein
VIIKERKSKARQIEQKLITSLRNNSFAMFSFSEATNLSFGATNIG